MSLGRYWKWPLWLLKLSPALEAEWRALEWATDIARNENWSNVLWSTDAKTIVNELVDGTDPTSWSFRYVVIKIKQNFMLQIWKLAWNGRSSNLLADSLAKLSFNYNSDVVFDSSHLFSIPVDMAKIACIDRRGGSVLL